jgi:hypothetical protein
MKVVSWPQDSVRPYESLWSLTHRFLWLNRPNRSDLSIDLRMSDYPTHCLDLIFGVAEKRDVSTEGLRELLNISSVEWRESTLDHFARGCTYSELWYCPACLKLAYHSHLFQLHGLSVCPIHLCNLRCGCPNCGAEIPTYLHPKVLHTPFACPSCKRSLTDPKKLVNPPSIDDLDQIGEILSWFRHISQIRRIESRVFYWKEVDLGLFGPIFTFLGQIAGQTAPIFCSKQWPTPPPRQIWHVTMGQGTYQFKGEASVEERDLGSRAVLLYRALLKRLLKGTPEVRKQVREFYRRRPIDPDSSEKRHIRIARTKALAILMFRASVEGWAGLPFTLKRKPNPDRIVATLKSIFPCVVEAGAIGNLSCSSAEWMWVRDHFIMAVLLNLFRRAEYEAGEAASRGYYDLRHIEGRFGPEHLYSLATRGPGGAIEFWSLTIPTWVEGQTDSLRHEVPLGVKSHILHAVALSAVKGTCERATQECGVLPD